MIQHGSTPSAHYLRSRMSRVCVAITGGTAEEMIEKADLVVRENPFIELRLDYLANPLATIPLFQAFLYERSEITAVATCRRVAGGGRFKGPPEAELEILAAATGAGFHLVDLEIETAEVVTREQIEDLRSRGAGLILSSHDFEGTRDLDKTFARLQLFDPDFYKIVSTAKSLSDNVEMKRFLERTSDRANIIGICMGEQGLVSRVFGVRAGSVFTFAAASEGEETGPGQIAARTLLETYRIQHIDNSTRMYGVAGTPIRHSLSPVMMNSAFRRETVNGVFLAFETRKLSDLLKLVREAPIQGLAVTMPLKQEILPYLEKTDAISAKIGACNTVVRSQDGRLFGFNTDVGGIVRPLERRLQLNGAKILVLGAGGAARAAVFGLAEKGADVTILNRTPETAQKLAKQAKARTIKREQVAKTHFDVIVHATPAGMAGQKLQMILNPEELNARIVFDTVYNPIDTPLIRAAREKGLAVITGVEMFVQQGARQFEIWTGKPAPEEEMLRVVLHALRRRAESDNAAGQLGPRIVPPRARVEAPPEPTTLSAAQTSPRLEVHVYSAGVPATAQPNAVQEVETEKVAQQPLPAKLTTVPNPPASAGKPAVAGGGPSMAKQAAAVLPAKASANAKAVHVGTAAKNGAPVRKEPPGKKASQQPPAKLAAKAPTARTGVKPVQPKAPVGKTGVKKAEVGKAGLGKAGAKSLQAKASAPSRDRKPVPSPASVKGGAGSNGHGSGRTAGHLKLAEGAGGRGLLERLTAAPAKAKKGAAKR